MNNDSNLVRAKHVESVATAAKNFWDTKKAQDINLSELENLSGMTIDTSQPTVDGALWYAHTNGELQLRLHYGDHDYSLDGAPAAPEMICEWSNTSNPTNSRAVTVLSNWADFGVQENDSPQGAEIYSGLYSITAAQDNSTIICNAANNHITICGGENNSLLGGIGRERYYFASGGGTIGDFGINTTKNMDIKLWLLTSR